MPCSNQKLMFVPNYGGRGVFNRYVNPTFRSLDLARMNAENKEGRFYLVGCGQCVECRLQKSRETATRILLETKTSHDVWGVTCTYDDDHLPMGNLIVDDLSGEVIGQRPTLSPRDHTLFMKDLRIEALRQFGCANIRFYMAGEYGSKSARPHFHYIFFNLALPADDVTLLPEKSSTGEDLFQSNFLDSIWKKGRVRLNAVNWQYAAYCARYIMKKQLGKGASVYKELGIVPEFTRCSTRPGLGYEYFKRNQGKLLERDRVLVKRALKLEEVPLPKYFLRKAEEEGFDLTSLKDRRQEQATANALKIQAAISDDYFDYLKKQEVVSAHKNKALTRSDF